VAEARIGLALSSGGARGSAHVGVLKVLEQEGLAPAAIAGTSMGAEIGAAFAADIPLPEIETLWRSTSMARVAKMLRPTIPWSGWSSGRQINRSLTALFGDRRFEDLTIPCAAMATNLETGEPVVIDSGPIVPAVRASLSVPGLFTPVWLDGQLLIDGGVSNPMPVAAARAMDVDLVIAVDVLVEPAEVHLSGIQASPLRDRVNGSSNGAGRFHPSVFSVLFQMSTVFQKRICTLQLRDHPPDLIVRPDFRVDPPTYSHVGCGIEAGETAMRAALPRLRQLLSEWAPSTP